MVILFVWIGNHYIRHLRYWPPHYIGFQTDSRLEIFTPIAVKDGSWYTLLGGLFSPRKSKGPTFLWQRFSAKPWEQNFQISSTQLQTKWKKVSGSANLIHGISSTKSSRKCKFPLEIYACLEINVRHRHQRGWVMCTFTVSNLKFKTAVML